MDWHRLFGLLLTDFFTNSPFVVELEKDLSLKQQFLDIVILRQRKGRLTERLPDGLDDLADHNLLTFKSHREALDDWALKELTGHYVNYRKQLAATGQPLLPESAFRLYAVCSRFPHNLAQTVPWQERQPGVYDCQRGTDCIRVVVASQLPLSEPNALLSLFSAAAEQVNYGKEHYRQHSPETSTLLYQLLGRYQDERVIMPYTMEDFLREHKLDWIKDMSPKERSKFLGSLPLEEKRKFLGSLSLEEKRKFASALPPEVRLMDLPPEVRLMDLPPEVRLKDLPLEERLKDVTPEQIEAYLERLKTERPAGRPKKGRKK